MIIYLATIFLMPFSNHPLLSYNFNGITPIKLVGMLAFVYALLEIWKSKYNWLISAGSEAFLYLLFVGSLCLSTAFNQAFNSQVMGMHVSFLLLMTSTLALVKDLSRLKAVVLTLLVTMNISALYMYKAFLMYRGMYAGFRPSGTSGDPNFAALNFLAVMPLAFFLGQSCTDKKWRLFYAVTFLNLLGAVLLSQSRGGVIALAVLIVVLIFKNKNKLRNMIVFIASIVIIQSVLDIDVMKRFNKEESGVAISTDSRHSLLVAGYNMIADNLLLGVGPGQYKFNSMKYNDELTRPGMAHNMYVELLGELGLLGFFVFMLLIKKTLRRADNTMPETDWTHLEVVFKSFKLGLIVYLIGATFLSAEYEKIFWFLIAAIAATRNISAILIAQTKPTYDYMLNIN